MTERQARALYLSITRNETLTPGPGRSGSLCPGHLHLYQGDEKWIKSTHVASTEEPRWARVLLLMFITHPYPPPLTNRHIHTFRGRENLQQLLLSLPRDYNLTMDSFLLPPCITAFSHFIWPKLKETISGYLPFLQIYSQYCFCLECPSLIFVHSGNICWIKKWRNWTAIVSE